MFHLFEVLPSKHSEIHHLHKVNWGSPLGHKQLPVIVGKKVWMLSHARLMKLSLSETQTEYKE